MEIGIITASGSGSTMRKMIVNGAAVKIFPLNDAFKDPELQRVINRLLTNLSNGHDDFTWSLLDSQISYREGTIATPNVGVAWWRGIEAVNANLLNVLPDGGVLERVIDRKMNIMKYSVPYYYFGFPFNILDPAECVVDITGCAKIYSEPTCGSAVMSEAAYEIMCLAGDVGQRDPKGQFLYVRDSLGVCGYVRTDSVRSPLGPEFVFIKDCRYAELGEWKLSAFDRLSPSPASG